MLFIQSHPVFSFFLHADTLPYSIRILLESAIRNCDGFQVMKEDVEKILDWEKTSPKQVEIPFKPARVILQVGISVDLSELFSSQYDRSNWSFSKHEFLVHHRTFL